MEFADIVDKIIFIIELHDCTNLILFTPSVCIFTLLSQPPFNLISKSSFQRGAKPNILPRNVREIEQR